MMKTARELFHACRRAGIDLAVDGDGIAFDAPADVAVPVNEIRDVKPELLAVLRGDYAGAAAALIARIADEEARDDLLFGFDERAGIVEHDGGMSRVKAERQAYIELAGVVEGGRR